MVNKVKAVRLKVDGTNWVGAAGTTDLTSESVDMQGYEGVEFLVGFGAITSTAVTVVKVQQSAVADSGQADLAGSAQSVADNDDNKVVRTAIYRPQKRYVNTVVDRGTANAVVDFVLALLYDKTGKTPIVQHATIIGTPEIAASPAEGTA